MTLNLTENINKFESKEYKISRGAYKSQCTTEYFISLLMADAFLAKLLKYIGFSDALTGIVSSLISVTFIFQLVSLAFAGKVKSTKKSVTVLDTLSQVLFMLMYLVPFFALTQKVKTVVIFLLIIGGYVFLYLNNNTCYKWGNSFVNPEKRGIYSAQKEMISLISGIAFTLFIGYAFDFFEESKGIEKAFGFMAVCMAVVIVANFVSLALIKDEKVTSGNDSKSIKDILSNTLGNRNVRNVIVLCSILEISRYMVMGFLGTYKTAELGYSIGQVQLINMAGCLGRFAVSIPFGKYSDKHGYAKGFELALLILAASYVFGIFASPAARWCIIVHVILNNMSLAGLWQNCFNMTYYFSDKDYILEGMAVVNSIKGIAGFVASLIGGVILSAIQSSEYFTAKDIYAQQVLMLVATALAVVTIVFCKKVVSKQKGVKQ